MFNVECVMFKEIKVMKKTLRYLLIVIAMVNFLSVSAQTPLFGKPYKPYRLSDSYKPVEHIIYGNVQAYAYVQMPRAEMRSTSPVYMATGSTLPLAAVIGTKTTYDNPGGPAKMRRDVGGGGSTADDEDPDAPEEPFPLGDAALPLALLACVYMCARAFLRRKRA